MASASCASKVCVRAAHTALPGFSSTAPGRLATPQRLLSLGGLDRARPTVRLRFNVFGSHAQADKTHPAKADLVTVASAWPSVASRGFLSGNTLEEGAALSAPALVLHRTRDRVIRVEHGRLPCSTYPGGPTITTFLVRQQLERFRGREIDTAGDGFLATFDGLARAVRCARAISEAVKGLNIRIRVGFHTGEAQRNCPSYWRSGHVASRT